MEIIKLKHGQDISTYNPSPPLKQVIKMARTLGRPLLLTGKPGTGKTQFAHWYAKFNHEEANEKVNEFNEKVFQFNTKSTSIYTDLFYEYDAVSHFRKTQIERNSKFVIKKTDINGKLKIKSNEITAADFITLTALGFAIVCAKGLHSFDNDPELQKIIAQTKEKFHIKEEELRNKSVVLIDEVDKAPRDFPNDLLYEIENSAFSIKEINRTIKLDDSEKQNIVIILTSNEEKNLPNAFLRRCLFFYIDFPDDAELISIISHKLDIAKDSPALKEKIEWFMKTINNLSIEKKPSTSEYIDWINYLDKHGLLDKPMKTCEGTLSILLKKKDDLEMVKNKIEGKS